MTDPFKAAWQAALTGTEAGAFPPRESPASLERRLRHFHRAIAWRDGRETGSALALMVVFAGTAVAAPPVVAKIGASLVVVGLAVIVVRLRAAARREREDRVSLTMATFCRAELAALDAQIHLLESVLWWYLALPSTGLVLFFLGVGGASALGLLGVGATLAVGALVWWLNRRTVRTSLLPLRESLAALVQDLQD